MQLEVSNLSFNYEQGREDALKDISFTVEKGSYTTIIGHNGSGKSTIAKLLVGLLEKKRGSIKIDGVELSEENIYEIRDKIAIVFQNPDNQFIGSTVRDDIAFGLENHNIEPSAMDNIINYFAKEVNMSDFLDHEPSKLSGGQKQRVALAGVLAINPEILIMDESTSMLDPKGKKEVNELVNDIHHRHGTTIISITHDIEEVNRADQVIVLNDGELVFDGSPKDILLLQKELTQIQLDVPFSVRLANKLSDKGIYLQDFLNEERIVDELWQLSLKK
ncbi:MAG: energy-coupling factor transporter ATPase [Erysipelothrix sp.]|nr:energy-coupling factor transporter ATPase [Erysipelothrix sp.]